MTTFVALTVGLVVALIVIAKVSDAAKDGTLREIWANRRKAKKLLGRWLGTFMYISIGLSNARGIVNPEDPSLGLPWWTYWITAPMFLIWGARRIAEDVLADARYDALKAIRNSTNR